MKNDTLKLRKILINICLVLAYLFVGILRFPSGNKPFNQLYYITIGILFIIIVCIIYKKDLTKEIKEFGKNIFKNIIYIMLISLLSVVVVTIGNFLKDLLVGWVQMSSYKLVYPNIAKYPIYVFFVMVIYTPLIESIVFNKSIHNIIENKYLFVIITSIIYGIMQVGIGFNNLVAIISIVPYMFFLFFMSSTYVKKKNIFFPIFIWLLYSGFQFFVQSTVLFGWK